MTRMTTRACPKLCIARSSFQLQPRSTFAQRCSKLSKHDLPGPNLNCLNNYFFKWVPRNYLKLSTYLLLGSTFFWRAHFFKTKKIGFYLGETDFALCTSFISSYSESKDSSSPTTFCPQPQGPNLRFAMHFLRHTSASGSVWTRAAQEMRVNTIDWIRLQSQPQSAVALDQESANHGLGVNPGCSLSLRSPVTWTVTHPFLCCCNSCLSTQEKLSHYNRGLRSWWCLLICHF